MPNTTSTSTLFANIIPDDISIEASDNEFAEDDDTQAVDSMLMLVSLTLLEILADEQINGTHPLLVAEIGRFIIRISEGEQDPLMSDTYDTASIVLVANAILDVASHCFIISLQNGHFVRETFKTGIALILRTAADHLFPNNSLH